MKILVTGVAGFIGMYCAQRLLERGDTVVGIDNLNDYYDVQLKKDRLKNIDDKPGFTFIKMDLSDRVQIETLFSEERFDGVINLGAQAGVRYSLKNPHAYIQSNVVGFLNILEGCRHNAVKHLVYASSSSVYGSNKKMPFSEHDNVDHPVSLYAATKKSSELMAHTYSHLYNIPTTGLRFFTVYGPWGRPDMSPSLFAGAILRGEAINVFNNGDMRRDFTYIDDIVAGVLAALDHPPPKKNGAAPHRVYNIGNHRSEPLPRLIEILESALGRKAEQQMEPMQPGDVKNTYADITAIQRDLGFQPTTPIDIGVPRFVDWYRDYHQF